jgi:hypothetical protein
MSDHLAVGIDPKVKNPQSVHWERAMAIFDLLF